MLSKAWNAIRFCCLLGLIGVAAVAACTPWVGGTPTATLDTSLIDMSIVTGIPCAPPCWYGLELGRSTKAEVLAEAKTLSFIDPSEFPEQPCSYWDPSIKAPVPATLLSLKCREPKGQTCAGLTVSGGVLVNIGLFSHPPITLGEAVAHLGAPEFVKISAIPPDLTLCDVGLIWKQRGIWVAFHNSDNNNPFQRQGVRCTDVRGGKGVSPNLPVKQILYQLPDQFADVPHAGGDFPWTGFAQP